MNICTVYIILSDYLTLIIFYRNSNATIERKFSAIFERGELGDCLYPVQGWKDRLLNTELMKTSYSQFVTDTEMESFIKSMEKYSSFQNEYTQIPRSRKQELLPRFHGETDLLGLYNLKAVFFNNLDLNDPKQLTTYQHLYDKFVVLVAHCMI